MSEKLLTATRALEPELVHYGKLNRLWNLGAVHVETVFGPSSALLYLRFVTVPLICNNVVATETPDRNDHFGLAFWSRLGNQFYALRRMSRASYPAPRTGIYLRS